MTAKSNIVTLNGVDYDVGQMTDHQKALLQHVRDLDRQVMQAEFSLTQLRVGREAFLTMLIGSVRSDESSE